MREFILRWLQRRQLEVVADSPLRNKDGSLYMSRWWIVKPSWWTFDCGVRLHHIHSSDDDRALHDHPWHNISWVLRGGYWEVLPRPGGEPVWLRWLEGGREDTDWIFRDAGSVVARRAEHRHRLVLPPSQTVWTIFITGPYRRRWGFTTPTGWVSYKDYLQ